MNKETTTAEKNRVIAEWMGFDFITWDKSLEQDSTKRKSEK